MDNYETMQNLRNRLRQEANERAHLRAALTPKQQLAKLDGRPGEAKRERARLTKQKAKAHA